VLECPDSGFVSAPAFLRIVAGPHRCGSAADRMVVRPGRQGMEVDPQVPFRGAGDLTMDRLGRAQVCTEGGRVVG